MTRPLLLLFVLQATVGLLRADDGNSVDFSRDILPILSNKCFVCHGPDGEASEDLRLDSYDAAIADLGDRKAIDPAALERSELLLRIHDEENPMPPTSAAKQLTHNERNLLGRWVREGGQYQTHWSFIPPQKASLKVDSRLSTANAIDAFVKKRLQQHDLVLAAEADRGTLARRVALVLTGLPPQPDLLSAYLADESPAAYEHLVNHLLASPHYGEHQARYWLDAIRYGDTHGLHLDNRRGIFPFRDWLIHAFNKNTPLDQLIIWQLAGDLLPEPTLEQRVATGFVRMNPSTAEGGVIPAEFQAKNNFDRVETLGTVFLGMTLTCARCHNHKYDPISQQEYYRLLAFFNSTSENPLDGNSYEYGPVIQAPASVTAWEQWHRFRQAQDRLLARASDLMTGSDAEVDPAILEAWSSTSRQDRWHRLADPEGPFASAELRDQAHDLARQWNEFEKTYSTTLIASDLPHSRVTKVLQRGEYDIPTGEPLQPGTLKVMGTFPDNAPCNRLGLAQWLVAPEHPLVARVLANRIWQRIFGEGLVRTPEDFGLQGEQPTHPQLLDWLAVELHDCGWNLKQMLRSFVLSRTFRQSSAFRSDVNDPDNRLLARGPRHRLDAEVIRDVALWSSGLLERHMGGEGIKPPQPSGLWSALMHPRSDTKNYVRDTDARQYCRSVYVYWKRTCPHPMLTLFDAPSRESSCVKRSRTNTSLQSLGLLNETQRIEAARMLAERLMHAAENDHERLDLLFLWLTCRKPNDIEQAACRRLLETNRAHFSQTIVDVEALLTTGDIARDTALDAAEHASWTQVAVTILASDLVIMLY
ncbi:MAG: PSD1 and planctomycete cytochrome C domain-containing protein [Pirellulaceae bacterium]|nr:PSD1 and planctomycete cytochrome C domain-containing protein [Pirellulaceae bacterium]